MRTALIILALLLPTLAYAEVTVTYSQEGERVCPANSYLIGSVCQCSLGYIAKNNACVKPDTAPAETPSQYQIYQDILMSVTVNEKMTCAQLGWITTGDKDMCTRYTASTEKSKWVGIQRPATPPTTAILNPWAPPSQQTMNLSSASTTIEPTIVPKPQATTTTVLKPDDETLAQQALAEIASAKKSPASEPAVTETKKEPEPMPEPEKVTPVLPVPIETLLPVEDTGDPSIATTTDPINISSMLVGLVPLTDSVPAAAASAPMVSEDEPRQSFFARLFGWLFGWI